MPRLLLTALLCAAAAATFPSAASAINVAAGPDGRALLAWPADAGMQFAERATDGTFTSPATIAPAKTYPAFLSSGPGTAATLLAYDESNAAARGLVIARRPAGAIAFAPPEPFAAGQPAHVISSASNARGDAAVLMDLFQGHLVLLTATGGGPLGSPQDIPTTSETAAVAVGSDGRVLLSWYEFSGSKGVRARLGSVGSPLGPPARLSSGSQFTDVGAALDDAGTATVAFTRMDSRRRAELVVRRAGPDGVFGARSLVARGGPPAGGAGFATFRVAAAGRTTALAFDANDADGRLGVAIARGGGRFGPVQRPTVGLRQPFPAQPYSPTVAVDGAGDVLLAYSLGFYGNAVHVTLRRAGEAGFSAPRVISSLGHGGTPVAALLSDRTPLVAWDNGLGDARYTTRIAGRRPDLTSPLTAVTLLGNVESRLRSSNTVDVRIRCSEPCVMSIRATLRTSTGRTILGEQHVVLGRAAVTKRFTFDPSRRSGRARGGSILRVTVDVENSSGASREIVRQLTLRRR